MLLVHKFSKLSQTNMIFFKYIRFRIYGPRTLISMTSSSVGSRKTHTAMISMARETPPKRRNMKGMRSNTCLSVKYLKVPTNSSSISIHFCHSDYPLVFRVVSRDVNRCNVIRVYKLSLKWVPAFVGGIMSYCCDLLGNTKNYSSQITDPKPNPAMHIEPMSPVRPGNHFMTAATEV